MAKWANDAVMDAALTKVATATNMIVCSGASAPADRAGALAAALATVAVTPGDGNGDFTIANGNVSGRKVTMAEQDNITVDVSDDATHVALIDGSILLYVTTCTTPQALVAGNTVKIPTWKIEITDPS